MKCEAVQGEQRKAPRILLDEEQNRRFGVDYDAAFPADQEVDASRHDPKADPLKYKQPWQIQRDMGYQSISQDSSEIQSSSFQARQKNEGVRLEGSISACPSFLYI